jgi:hypothetical protein
VCLGVSVSVCVCLGVRVCVCECVCLCKCSTDFGKLVYIISNIFFIIDA